MTRTILLSCAIAAMLSATAGLPAYGGSPHAQYDMNTTVEHDQAGAASKQRAQKSQSKTTASQMAAPSGVSTTNSPTQQAPQTSNTPNWAGKNEKWLRDRY